MLPATERAKAELGCHRQSDGRYRCGHDGCSKICTLKAVRVHVPACALLTPEERRLQQISRDTVSRRGKSDKQPVRQSLPGQLASRMRVFGKQPPTAGGPCRQVLDRNFDPQTVLNSFQQRTQGKRPITLTDLPAPSIPSWWPPLTCRYCLKVFVDRTRRSKHVLGCLQMPYDSWLFRVRATQLHAKNGTFPCVHCGTKFLHAKAAGRHSVTCANRRQLFQLPLNLQQFHDLSPL